MPLFLKIFESTATAPEEFEKLMPQMMGYLAELKSAGKLRHTGPFADLSGGVDIIEADSLEEARELAQRDPFVANNLGTYTLKEWSDMIDHL